MANTLLTPTKIAKATAYQVRNNLVMGSLVNREFVNEFVKIGNSVNYRKPERYIANDGADVTAQIQDIIENSDAIVINKRKNVALQLDTQDMTLTIEKFEERHIMPASITLANQIDNDGCDTYKGIYNASGVAGTTPATYAALGGVGTVMSQFANPNAGRKMVLDPKAEYALPDGLKGLLLPARVNEFLTEASIGRVAKFDIFGDQNIKFHTAGVPGGFPLVAGAAQTGATINIDGMTVTTGTYLEGDLITFAGVNSVNPLSKDDTGDLQSFVVTANVTADGAGLAALAIDPPIVTSGAYQTVTAGPADNAVITLTASHRANLAFMKEAISLVTVPLEIPASATWSARETMDGISIRILKGFDILTDIETTRLDILYGWKVSNPEAACRLLG